MKVGDLVENEEGSVGLILGVGKSWYPSTNGWFKSMDECRRHHNGAGVVVCVWINGEKQEWICFQPGLPSKRVRFVHESR